MPYSRISRCVSFVGSATQSVKSKWDNYQVQRDNHFRCQGETSIQLCVYMIHIFAYIVPFWHSSIIASI